MLKWQNYSVGGKKGEFPLMQRASCQSISCRRLFCFYHMCCVVHVQDTPRAKIAAGAQNISEHMLKHVYN